LRYVLGDLSKVQASTKYDRLLYKQAVETYVSTACFRFCADFAATNF